MRQALTEFGHDLRSNVRPFAVLSLLAVLALGGTHLAINHTEESEASIAARDRIADSTRTQFRTLRKFAAGFEVRIAQAETDASSALVVANHQRGLNMRLMADQAMRQELGRRRVEAVQRVNVLGEQSTYVQLSPVQDTPVEPTEDGPPLD